MPQSLASTCATKPRKNRRISNPNADESNRSTFKRAWFCSGLKNFSIFLFLAKSFQMRRTIGSITSVELDGNLHTRFKMPHTDPTSSDVVNLGRSTIVWIWSCPTLIPLADRTRFNYLTSAGPYWILDSFQVKLATRSALKMACNSCICDFSHVAKYAIKKVEAHD